MVTHKTFGILQICLLSDLKSGFKYFLPILITKVFLKYYFYYYIEHDDYHGRI